VAGREKIRASCPGLLRSGQVTRRRLVGWRDIDNSNSWVQAA